MSLNITSSAEIARHQTNNSPAKALFSFPKSERFRRPKSYSNALCYEVNSSLNKRKSGRTLVKTTFGIQRPVLFYDKEQLAKPTPVTYRIKQNDFSNSYINRSFRKPKQTDSPLNLTTFGVGRDAFDHVVSQSGYNYQPHDLKIPGPTSYRPSSKRQQHRYTMRPRTSSQLFRINPAPGPGTYDRLNQLNPDGLYMVSKHPSANAPVFQRRSFAGPTKIERVPQPSEFAPGPGWYNLNTTYMHNQIKSSNGRHGEAAKKVGLGTAERLTYFKSKSFTPGPGQYLAPTAFGQYLSKHAPLFEQNQNQGCKQSRVERIYQHQDRLSKFYNMKKSSSYTKSTRPNTVYTGNARQSTEDMVNQGV